MYEASKTKVFEFILVFNWYLCSVSISLHSSQKMTSRAMETLHFVKISITPVIFMRLPLLMKLHQYNYSDYFQTKELFFTNLYQNYMVSKRYKHFLSVFGLLKPIIQKICFKSWCHVVFSSHWHVCNSYQ